MDTGTKVIDDLLADLKLASFDVVNVGARYRVTNPAGGKATFIPLRLPRNGKLQHVVDGLVKIGFTEDIVREAREADRQRRLEEDRKAAERALNAAKMAAAASTAPLGPPPEEEVGHHRKTAVKAAKAKPEAPRPAPVPRAEVIEMTPDFAADLLRSNRWFTDAARGEESNRRFREPLAQQYCRDMLAGDWDVTNQGIGLDIDGEVADGQHRLVGLVLAGQQDPGIVVPMLVVYDLPKTAKNKVDTGMRRTASDVMVMHGEGYTTNLAASVRLCVGYDHIQYVGPKSWDGISHQRLLDWLADNPGIREVMPLAGAAGATSIILGSAAGAAYFLVAREGWGMDAARDLQRQLMSGAGLEDDDPILALRNALLRQRGPRQKRDPVVQFAMVIKMWNAKVLGQRRSLCRWLTNEPFPRMRTPQ